MEKKERIIRRVILSGIAIATLIALILTIKIEPADRNNSSNAQPLLPSAPIETVSSEEAASIPSSALTASKEATVETSSFSIPSVNSKSASTVISDQTTSSEKVTSIQNASSLPLSSALPSTSSAETKPKTYHCTVEIRCDMILKKLEELKPEKKPFVPQDGIILPKVTVEFTEGETAFDILLRVTRSYNIQMEYRADGLFGGAYIEGIGHLYDFDCGDGSGWMYQINSQFPNYGCSSYEMKGNDHMVWCYTCDIGKDVGDPYWD